jgi:hypothetical protein
MRCMLHFCLSCVVLTGALRRRDDIVVYPLFDDDATANLLLYMIFLDCKCMHTQMSTDNQREFCDKQL